MCPDLIGTSLRSHLEPFAVARDYLLPDNGQTAMAPEPQMTNEYTLLPIFWLRFWISRLPRRITSRSLGPITLHRGGSAAREDFRGAYLPVSSGMRSFSRGPITRSCWEMARAASTVRLLISSF